MVQEDVVLAHCDELLSRKATEATVAQFMALLANCEMARYSQHHTDASMEKDFSEAVFKSLYSIYHNLANFIKITANFRCTSSIPT